MSMGFWMMFSLLLGQKGVQQVWLSIRRAWHQQRCTSSLKKIIYQADKLLWGYYKRVRNNVSKGVRVRKQSDLLGHVSVFLLLFGLKHSPPISQDLGRPAVVQTRVFLPHQRTVAFAEEEESIHWPPCSLFIWVLLHFLCCASTLHLWPLVLATQHWLLITI